MSTHSVTFKVDDVEETPIYKDNYMDTHKDILHKRLTQKDDSYSWKPKPLTPTMHIEATSEGMGQMTACNGFLATCTQAYAKHHKLELGADDIKLLLTQAFSIHINENSDTLRNKLVNHEDKKTLIVRRDDFVRGGNNPWTEVFSAFTDKIREDIKDGELVDKIQKPSQTTTENTMAAINVSIMDAFSKFYNYELHTMCGIPSITLKGSVEDWKDLKDLVHHMGQYEFTWFTDKMESILDEFISASEGHPNLDFWRNFVKKEGGSGGPYYTGNIIYFFPYLKKYDGGHRRNPFNNKVTASDIPDGLSSVPFKWNYYGTEYDMKFIAGFASTTVSEEGALKPDISWAIEDMGLTKLNYEIPDILMKCYSEGVLYEPCGLHYGKPNGGIICDLCRKHVNDKCIGYGEKTDLCFECMDLIKEIVANKSA